MNKPKCANPKCSNDGWISMGGGYYCGDCVIKYDKIQKEKLKKQMEEMWQ